jgi:tRNA(fMet)-specific endonuclease VapC
MNLYVLDTDSVSLFQHGYPLVVQRADACSAGQLAVTVITVEEQLSGWYAELRRTKQRDQLAAIYLRMATTVQFLSRMQILPYSEAAMARVDQFKAAKLNVAKSDLRIAAIVLEHGAILVTRNLRDFRRIPGLTIEDWSG